MLEHLEGSAGTPGGACARAARAAMKTGDPWGPPVFYQLELVSYCIG